ncbi:MAG: hypothetical protein ACI9UQ_000213 [Candidatus Krumholzibacteriia bacterium]|jgi:hypothetical protein
MGPSYGLYPEVERPNLTLRERTGNHRGKAPRYWFAQIGYYCQRPANMTIQPHKTLKFKYTLYNRRNHASSAKKKK